MLNNVAIMAVLVGSVILSGVLLNAYVLASVDAVLRVVLR